MALAAGRCDEVKQPPLIQVADKHGQFILLWSTAACQAAGPYLELFSCAWSQAQVISFIKGGSF